MEPSISFTFNYIFFIRFHRILIDSFFTFVALATTD